MKLPRIEPVWKLTAQVPGGKIMRLAPLADYASATIAPAQGYQPSLTVDLQGQREQYATFYYTIPAPDGGEPVYGRLALACMLAEDERTWRCSLRTGTESHSRVMLACDRRLRYEGIKTVSLKAVEDHR